MLFQNLLFFLVFLFSVLFSTKKVEGSFRIIQGPFSIYKPEYSVKSSSSFSIFSSSFTYQVSLYYNNTELHDLRIIILFEKI